MERQIYQARWVFPVNGPPLEDGIVEIEGTRIAAVYGGAHSRAIDLGNVALIPGLVNAHTHLEFSQLRAPLEPAAPFTDWIRAIMKSRFETEQPVTERIQQGISECLSSGTTTVGEIATSEESLRLFNAESQVPRAVVFRECLGFTPDRKAGQEQVAAAFLEEPIRPEALQRLFPGLSPHAPYSVHPDLYLNLVQQARDQGVPVAIHLGETSAEYDLLERKEGAFVDLLSELGLWDPEILQDGMRMTDYLAPLAELPAALAVHGNYFGPPEWEFLQGAPAISVVYCPRTHHYFGHPAHPWLTMIEQGINVALGTDSRASNPDLSLWKELLFLREICPQVPTELILECGTLAGARALGFAEETGSLEVGKAADLALIQLPEEAGGGTGSDLLLDSRSDVARVMLNGVWIN
ncbi:amidohydrolase family protein [Gimesia panareensis]|uniref:amidohydrolase family protein n=1 Tax=Gimesia panareensis TaxID=2527978 RepID=UPI0011880AC0|nr:amidohydrolase family protein [Gimesia panareensis]QDU48220.1 Aminodeoxyfutalosine deaminase [Gimesia panareensis]